MHPNLNIEMTEDISANMRRQKNNVATEFSKKVQGIRKKKKKKILYLEACLQ